MRMVCAVLALALVTPVLAGCTIGPTSTTNGPRVQALWDGPRETHLASALLTAERFEISGPRLRIAEDPQEIELRGPLPPPVSEGRFPVAFTSGRAPETLILEDATVAGKRGTLVFGFGEGVKLAGEALDANLSLVRAERGVVRAPLSTSASLGLRLEDELCPLDPETGESRCEGERPARLPEEFRGGFLTEYRLSLARPFTLRATNVTFIDAGGNRTSLADEVRVERARALVSPSGPAEGASSIERVIPALASFRWSDNLTVEAATVTGEFSVSRVGREIDFDRLSSSWRGVGRFSINTEGDTFTIAGLAGGLTDLVTDGVPRLGSEIALLPTVVEASGETGKVVRFKILIAEGTAGAAAHVTGYRVEGTNLSVKYVGWESFGVTRALFDLVQDVANVTGEVPIVAPVTIPMLAALGVTIPFIAFLEGFAEVLLAIFPPQLSGPIPAAGAQLASFEVEMRASRESFTLTVEGSNFAAKSARVTLTPSS